MVLKGHTNIGFGATAVRDSMIERDPLSNPYKEPTFRKSPSPNKYHPNTQTLKHKKIILSKVGSVLPPPEEQLHHMFSSNVSRDIVESIPKDLRYNPGPGSYDTEI